MTVIVDLVVLALLAYGGYVAARAIRRRLIRRAAVNALPPAERERWDALQAARRNLRDSERQYTKRITAAERELTKARNSPKIATLTISGSRKLELYPDRLATPEGTYQLHASVSTTVDSGGNLAMAMKSRSTLTRMAGGAMVAGPVGLIAGGMLKKNKKATVDTRELYLMIDGGDWGYLAQCSPDDGAKVRGFAQALTLAARQADAARQRQREVVQRMEAAVVAAKNDTADVYRARELMAACERDAPALEAGALPQA